MPIHVWDNSDANIRVVPIDIADGVTGSAIRTYTVTGLNDVQSLVFDGTHLHATRWNDETVHVFLPSTADGQAAAVVRTYEVSGIRQPGAMAFDGVNIHIGDREDDNFRVVAPDTADGETATVITTYTVPGSGDMRGMTFDGTNLHIGDYTDDNFRVIAVPTADGAQTVLRTYTVAGVSLNRAIAYADGNIHVSDVTDDNFRVVAVPTTDGAQTILRTYTVTGIGNARGMELVPNTAPVFDQASYSFGSVAIAVNTVVGSVVATDADNDPLTYSLTGTDAGNFAIDANGEVTVETELAEDSTYTFNVVVNDGTVDVTMPVTVESITTGPPTDATFTITGPTADIYAGQTVDFTIESNIDITDFTFDDVVLTGATFVSFTLTSENTWRYRVTADAGAGVIAMIIREDTVSPGNNAASQTFVRNANPTVAITTTDTDIRVNHIFTVELDWSSNVTGFANADVTVTGATKLNFTGSGRNYVLALRSSTTPGNIVVTVRENAIDQRNAETSVTFVNNDLVTITLTPRETTLRNGDSTVVDMVASEDITRFAQADLSVNVGTLSGFTGSDDTYEVTVTAPATGEGIITLTLQGLSTQPENHAASVTINYGVQVVTVDALTFESFKVTASLEIEGVDATEYLVANQTLYYQESLDYPDFGSFSSKRIQVLLNNRSGTFDTGRATNFWTTNSLPSTGVGAKVLLRVTKGTEVFTIAGRLELVRQELAQQIVTLVITDLSLLTRFGILDDFGQELTRRITDYDGATEDYQDGQYRFKFPRGFYPISPNSVSAKIIDGMTETDVTIVEELPMTGMIPANTAKVNYAEGYMDFAAAPDDAEDTVIDATWKINFPYKRPDSLVAELMKHSGVQGATGIMSDSLARYAIGNSQIKGLTDEHFSSNGRPFIQENGVVRWIQRNGDIWQMVQDQRFLEYDADADEYSLVSGLPMEDISGIDMTDYGEFVADESFVPLDENGISVVNVSGIAVDASAERIYALARPTNTNTMIYPYLLDGTLVAGDIVTLLDTNGNDDTNTYQSAAIYNGQLYTAETANPDSIRIFSLSDGSLISENQVGIGTNVRSIAVTPTRIITASDTQTTVLDHSFNTIDAERTSLRAAFGNVEVRVIASNDTHFFGKGNVSDTSMQAVTLAYVNDDDSDLTLQDIFHPIAVTVGLAATNSRLYTYGEDNSNGQIHVYRLGEAVNFGNYVPYQFATTDGDTLYFLASNNTQGNAVSASTLRRIKVYRYVKSTDTWTDLLNATTGQPQLSEAYQIDGTVYHLADNRKNFQIVRYNNDNYLFYRRVQATESGIAHYRASDDAITDVFTDAHAGADDFGLPYAMDFYLEETGGNVICYTFTVKVEFNADGTWNQSTFRILRRQVLPQQAQTTLFTETTTGGAADTNEEYAVSVSGVILVGDTFYFVMDYHRETDGLAKSELCRVNKDGTGTRTVIKTYDDHTLGARSPVLLDGRPFYLEGGWVRPPAGTDEADDLHDYPDSAGQLIEINTSHAVVNHGQVWRNATKANSPDPDADGDAYMGWGLFNSVISNMVIDADDNLHFVAGYGVPYNVNENLPFSSIDYPVFLPSNFHWLQWGNDIATKIREFRTGTDSYWALAERLAQTVGWEIGFGPRVDEVDTFQTANSAISDWSANAVPFFRESGVQQGTLRTAIGTGAITQIQLSPMTTPFPTPPTNALYRIIIDKEVFGYTGVSTVGAGVNLTGVTRGLVDSDEVSHANGASAFFVSAVLTDTDTSLVDVTEKTPDIVNLYNVVRIAHKDDVHITENASSITENGRLVLGLTNELLTGEDTAWLTYLSSLYLGRYATRRELLRAQLPLRFDVGLGELVVLNTTGGAVLDYVKFRVMRRQHDFRSFQTQMLLREV